MRNKILKNIQLLRFQNKIWFKRKILSFLKHFTQWIHITMNISIYARELQTT